MSKEFDATMKDLLEAGPADWVSWLRGLSGRPVTLIDADVSTVTAAADKVLRVEDETPWVLHLEPHARRERELGRRLNLYNAVLSSRHRVSVETVVLLLRRDALTTDLTGVWEQFRRDGQRYLEFHYDVVRIWEQPLGPLLSGGPATLPLAPLTDEAEAVLPAVIQRMEERLRGVAPEPAGKLWTAAHVLIGLRYPIEFVDNLFLGVPGMEESVTYQAIIAKGQLREARKLVLRLGNIRFGPPSPETEMAIQSITNLDRLEQLGDRLVIVSSWQELLATP